MEPNLSLLAPEQLYGSTMSVMSEFLPLPIRHMYFSQYRVHPIVWLLKPLKKNRSTLKITDGVDNRVGNLVNWLYDYEEIDYDKYSLIDANSVRIITLASWHPTWVFGYYQYYNSSESQNYKVSINDDTLIFYNRMSGFDGDMDISEVFCRKMVCSRVLCNCECEKCDYYGRDKKYQGNHPFDLTNLATELKNINKFRFKECLPPMKILNFDGNIIDEKNAHRYYFWNADIKINENYVKSY